MTSISRISTSRNGRVLHTLLRCVVELTISATANNSNSLRSGNVVYIKLALALSESVSERNAPYWAVTTEVLRSISVQSTELASLPGLVIYANYVNNANPLLSIFI